MTILTPHALHAALHWQELSQTGSEEVEASADAAPRRWTALVFAKRKFSALALQCGPPLQ